MKTVLMSLALELVIECVKQIVSAGEIGEFLDHLEGKIKESETKIDDALLPFLRAIRVVLGNEKEAIAEGITEAVRNSLREKGKM